MKKIIYTALLLLVTVSCDTWFEAEPKGGGQSGAKVFDNEASFRDYMNGIYTGLRSAELYGSNLTLGGVEFLAQSFVPDEGAEAWTKLDFSSEMGQNVSREAYAKLYAAIAAWAEDDFRSINGQIEYLLTECVRQRKKNGKYVSDQIDVPPELDLK